MTISDILVYADDTAGSRPRVAAAATIAGRHQAKLTGVFLRSEFMRSFWASEAVSFSVALDVDAIIRDHDLAVEAAAEDARQAFQAAAGEAGVSSDWIVINGDTDDALIAEARRFDLTVLPVRARPAHGDNRISAAGVGMASGGPVLVIPDNHRHHAVGKRIMVAWKDSRESARALRDAWPLLVAAEQVHVVVVSQHGRIGPDGELQRHFERHGIAANLIVAADADFAASEVIRRQAALIKADLIVMGLYGRPRLGEIVLGGASEDLLADPPAALFLSH